MFPIIDCHCHIYPDKIADKAVHGIGEFYHIGMCYDGKAETLLEQNKKYGITHSLIFSVATKPAQTKSINEFIAGQVKNAPDKFTGLGTIHPDSSDIKGDIEHLIELDLRGVKLHPDFQGISINDKRCYKIYELCQGKLPVLMHTGDIRYSYSNPDNLIPVLKDFPSLTVIGAHFGGYSVWDDAIKKLQGFENLFVDCSSAMAFISTEKSKELVKFYGADRIIYGTDYPMWKFGEELKRFSALELNDIDKQKILYKNACKLFKIDESKILELFEKSK